LKKISVACYIIAFCLQEFVDCGGFLFVLLLLLVIFLFCFWFFFLVFIELKLSCLMTSPSSVLEDQLLISLVFSFVALPMSSMDSQSLQQLDFLATEVF